MVTAWPTAADCARFVAFRAERQALINGAHALGWTGWDDRTDCHCDGGWQGVICDNSALDNQRAVKGL
jgi:hypothetical protein